MGDAAYFARSHKIDPKTALKKGFARTNRRLQCLQPAKEFTPPTKPPTGKRKPPEPYPGTRFGVGTILRASAAINDSLRQLGHLGLYETPAALPGAAFGRVPSRRPTSPVSCVTLSAPATAAAETSATGLYSSGRQVSGGGAGTGFRTSTSAQTS